MIQRYLEIRWAVLAAMVLGGGACAGGGDNFPVPMGSGDASLPERTVAETGPGGNGGGGGGTGGTGGRDGGIMVGDGGISTVTVEIDSPMKDAVQKGADRFTPSVNVIVDSRSASDPDVVSELVVLVTKVGARMPGPSTRLNQTKIDRVPEAPVEIYRFTGTPVDLSMMDSGSYELLARARTLAGQVVENKVAFVIDAGPVIRIDSPEENKAYRSTATVNVNISDAMFGPVDPADVTMTLGQQPLVFNRPAAGGSQYTATIEFTKYVPPLEGDQLLTVRAQNRNKTMAVAMRRFAADDKGPMITSTVPTTGALIGRVITISATVTDPAGVDPKVVAVVAHGDVTFEVRLNPPTAGGAANVYQALFDTTRLPINALYPSISFRASDTLGNESAVGYLVSLDNTPPIADLDPPEDFRLVKTFEEIDRCSWPFDPVGNDAVDDGQMMNVHQLFDVRARIEDRGNTPLFGGADLVPISGIDDTRAHLLILDDTSQVLVVDTNADGLCDDINPLLTPTTTPMSAKDALLINMVPVPVAGTGDYTPVMPPAGAPCISGTQSMRPPLLCGTTSLTAAIPYTTAGTPAIYTIPPVVAGDVLQCVGRQFDSLGSSIKDGWICMAVAVSDKLGNMQVSRPLRVCVDKDGQGGECSGTAPMPNCTGTATNVSGTVPMVDPTKPCMQWRRFPTNEYRKAL